MSSRKSWSPALLYAPMRLTWGSTPSLLRVPLKNVPGDAAQSVEETDFLSCLVGLLQTACGVVRRIVQMRIVSEALSRAAYR